SPCRTARSRPATACRSNDLQSPRISSANVTVDLRCKSPCCVAVQRFRPRESARRFHWHRRLLPRYCSHAEPQRAESQKILPSGDWIFARAIRLSTSKRERSQSPAGFGRGFFFFGPFLRLTQRRRTMVEGLWLPLVTPFRDGALDEASLRRMVRHYLGQPVDGFILAATTGEGLTIDEEETQRLVVVIAAETGGKRPLYLGISGSDT